MPEWVVSSQEAGCKLIAFLSSKVGNEYSARALKRAIENNCCQVNGRTERFASTLLGRGDHVVLVLEQLPASLEKKPKWDPAQILYEDEAVLIYNKPAGVTSDEKGVLQLLKPHYPHLQLVHRLDRETSGILLLAKNAAIFDDFVQQFKQFHVHKRYRAIVDGILKDRRGTVENYLGKKHAYSGQAIWGAVKSDKGLYAHTEWECLKTGKGASLVLCIPKTGRTHQIRVHLAGIGHPILGDFQYCKQFHCAYRPSRCLLHAEEIAFRHPLTKQTLSFQAPLPDDFLHAQKALFKM
ncbi:RluA family pseudouridine synthase [Candidatus Protochlamydia phocaeensis]|uniref:RluA family pseudouridine synthase n=1 Tax=Candidatus Protochlamydia phocaeensis TaxID=1414722 RepID=UPI00083969E1|nr:RluA family pseudouridine synthase [Candidatus Protochlamydia phocaeensis]